MQYSTFQTATTTAQTINSGLALAAEMGSALTGTTDTAEQLAILQKQLKWLMPAAYVSLCLLDDDGESYHVLQTHGESAHFSINEGLVGWALRYRVPLDIPDLLDETAFPPGIGGVAWHKGQGSLLVLPLLSGTDVFGALTIGAPRVGAYRATDRGLVQMITLQVAAAVRTALLMNELDGAEAIIAGMAEAVEAKDPYTRGHADRVTAYAIALADAAGLNRSLRDIIARAGPLHDVGKIGVPDTVLGKPGRLTDEEFALIKRHPAIGADICRPLRSLHRLLAGIRSHHEAYNGDGYPDGLMGTAIPLEARVLAIADTYDAMTSNRPYRTGMPADRALSIIARNDGPQWDPALVAAFLTLHEPEPWVLSSDLMPSGYMPE